MPLAIDELPLVALLGCFAEGETIVRGRRRAAPQGVRPDRDRRRRPQRRWAATSRRPTTASSCAAPAGCGAARSTPTATTAWRCSARSPGCHPRGRRGRRHGGRRRLLPGVRRGPRRARAGRARVEHRQASVRRGERGRRRRTCAVDADRRGRPGAVSAKETGVSPIETSQSRLETRPRRSRGTRICISVVQITVPRPSRAARRRSRAASAARARSATA